ncbi:Cysteine--tRNA ligase, partial [Bienertia sinuspersici]
SYALVLPHHLSINYSLKLYPSPSFLSICFNGGLISPNRKIRKNFYVFFLTNPRISSLLDLGKLFYSKLIFNLLKFVHQINQPILKTNLHLPKYENTSSPELHWFHPLQSSCCSALIYCGVMISDLPTVIGLLLCNIWFIFKSYLSQFRQKYQGCHPDF